MPVCVVFEVLSPGNTPKEMAKKLRFYERYGVSEYYEYDPDRIVLKGWLRSGNRLVPIENTEGWVSPILGIRFGIADDLIIFRPDGQIFLSPVEMGRQNVISLHEARRERLRAQEAESEAEQERLRAEMLEEKLKALEKLLRMRSDSP